MTILAVLLKSAVILAVAGLAGVALRGASSATRRLVLATAVVGVLALPVFSFLLPGWGLWRVETEREVVAAAEVVLAPLELAPRATPASSPERVESRGRVSASAPATAVLSSSRPTLTEVAVVLWTVGALLFALHLLAGLFWARRLERPSRAAPAAWERDLEGALEAFHLGHRHIGLVVSDRARVPTVVGVLSPTICVPADAVSWPAARRRMVLLHEVAHIAHGDNALNLLARVVCVVHWFNPLAWVVTHRLAIECEHAADDAVLARSREVRPSDYALELMLIARDGLATATLSAASTMAKPSELRTRIGRILDAERRRGGPTRAQRLAFWGGVLVVVGLLGCATAVQGGEPPPPAEATAPTSPLSLAVAEHYGVSSDQVELTIDEPLQGIVEDEIRFLVDRYSPRSVSVVAIDPCNGHVLALGSHGESPTELQAIEPGSTMKPLTVAAALEEGMSPDARFFCEHGVWNVEGRQVRDAHPAGWLDVGRIVALSSNIGAGQIYTGVLGWDRLRRSFDELHLAEAPLVELGAVEAGALPAGEGSALRGVLAANGVGLRVSPIQLAAAYAALANGGVYYRPTLASRVLDERGAVRWEHSPDGERVLSEATARAVVEMLERVVDDADGTGRLARVPGVAVAGKTGTVLLADTAEDGERLYSARFVGIVSPDDAQVVILVGVEGLHGDRFTGGQVAAPAFARIVSRARGVSAHVD